MRSLGKVRNVSGYIVMETFADGEWMFSHGLSIVNPPPPAERPVTHAPTLFVFSCLFICNFFKKCFFPRHPTVPIRLLLLFSFLCRVRAYFFSYPLIPASHSLHGGRHPLSHSPLSPRQRHHEQADPCQRAHLLPCRGREA